MDLKSLGATQAAFQLTMDYRVYLLAALLLSFGLLR
jgi:hypothetical protein